MRDSFVEEFVVRELCAAEAEAEALEARLESQRAESQLEPQRMSTDEEGSSPMSHEPTADAKAALSHLVRSARAKSTKSTKSSKSKSGSKGKKDKAEKREIPKRNPQAFVLHCDVPPYSVPRTQSC